MKPYCIGRGRSIKIFSYYHKLNHTIDISFKKQGIPHHLKRMNMAQSITPEDVPANNSSAQVED